jgi:hypothetical protein
MPAEWLETLLEAWLETLLEASLDIAEKVVVAIIAAGILYGVLGTLYTATNIPPVSDLEATRKRYPEFAVMMFSCTSELHDIWNLFLTVAVLPDKCLNVYPPALSFSKGEALRIGARRGNLWLAKNSHGTIGRKCTDQHAQFYVFDLVLYPVLPPNCVKNKRVFRAKAIYSCSLQSRFFCVKFYLISF